MLQSLVLASSSVAVLGFGAMPAVPAEPAPDVCLDMFDAPPVPACVDAVEQSPAEVTEGVNGLRDPTGTIIHDYEAEDLCLVNIHWHLGAEHMSQGQYDIPGEDFLENTYQGASSDGGHRRLLSGAESDPGWMCQGYDATDPAYTTPYNWEHCEGMHVGLTYEIHWPHSTAGHCGRLSDGLGGVFCHSHTPAGIGVQGQVFVVVNDDAYDVDDLASGMNVGLATNVAKYTGSTTGPSYNNVDKCSPYAPISWHVDRDCHKISAKSFDGLCKAMKEQGITKDVTPHGSRDLVSSEWTSNGGN